MVTFMRELWRPNGHEADPSELSPTWEMMARMSRKPWLALEVYNGRTVESIQTSAPHDVVSWLWVAGPRQLRKVTMLIPDPRRPHAPWTHTSISAIWQLDASSVIYFEDINGEHRQSTGERSQLPRHPWLVCRWQMAKPQ